MLNPSRAAAVFHFDEGTRVAPATYDEPPPTTGRGGPLHRAWVAYGCKSGIRRLDRTSCINREEVGKRKHNLEPHDRERQRRTRAASVTSRQSREQLSKPRSEHSLKP